jgi:hypothetical protein
MYVKSVCSNVKQGVDVQNLGKNTLIVGTNKAGKSSVINSIELALGGFASDLMGKEAVRKPGDLISLSKDGKTLSSSAEVIIDEERGETVTCSWKTEKTSKGVKRPIHKREFITHFPFTEVKENLVGSVEKARGWLLGHIAKTTTAEFILSQLKPSVQGDYTKVSDALRNSRKDLSEIDLLLVVAEEQSSFAREKGREIKVLENSAQGWASTLGAEPTAAELEALKGVQQEAFDAFSNYKATYQAGAEISSAKVNQALVNVQEIVKNLRTLEVKKAKLQPLNIQPLSDVERNLFKRLGHLQGFLDHVEDEKSCPVCQSSVSVPSLKEGFAESLRELTQKHQIHALYSQMSERIVSLRASSLEAVETWKTLKESQEDVKVTATLVDLRVVYDKSLSNQMEVESSLAGWKELRGLESRIGNRKLEQKKAKALSTQCKALCKKLLSKCVTDFSSKVSGFLPEGVSFELKVDSKTGSYSFGLIQEDGSFHSALSGVEWIQLVLAIGCVVSSEDSFNVFIPEERAIDHASLSEMMDALKDAPGQVLLTSTFHPTKPHAEWTIIDLNA